MNTRLLLNSALIFILAVLSSCAGDPSAKSTVKKETQWRTYERFKSDHYTADESSLLESGIYYDGRDFYIVIRLTDSGIQRYPEWACEKLVNSLYSYGIAHQQLVSDEEFFEFVLHFDLVDIVDGKYENLVVVTVHQRDVEKFLQDYADE